LKIEIEVAGKGTARVELDDRNPNTAFEIFENLPMEGTANVWLEENYFRIPLELDYENPSLKSVKGDLSYWPPGAAFCIFYGDSQPASEVNHIGRVTENLEVFEDVEDGDTITIKRLED